MESLKLRVRPLFAFRGLHELGEGLGLHLVEAAEAPPLVAFSDLVRLTDRADLRGWRDSLPTPTPRPRTGAGAKPISRP